jgi:hypothetical protein
MIRGKSLGVTGALMLGGAAVLSDGTVLVLYSHAVMGGRNPATAARRGAPVSAFQPRQTRDPR